jgi:selenide,water dikinase
LVQTLDFITAIGDGEGYTFGQIAAANSLSDVWAMGGKPITAMSIVCFPSDKLETSVLRSIILGALDKVNEAGVALVGGHSVRDNELKFGLSVTGIVHPDRIITNKGARQGDKLILTKPLGTGILNTAMKAGMLEESLKKKTVGYMTRLNKAAGEVMAEMGASAATDITGFGLIGHTWEMASGSNVAVQLEVTKVPVLEKVIEFSRMGIVPGKLHDNINYYACRVEGDLKNDEDWMSILNDPQTSGGLLISVSEDKAGDMLRFIHDSGSPEAAIIGQVTEGHKGHIYLK